MMYILIVGDPAYTDNYSVYGPLDSVEAALSWEVKVDSYVTARKVHDPFELEYKEEDECV